MEDIVRSISGGKESKILEQNSTFDLDDEKFAINIDWLNNKKFIKQLEKDNIDVGFLRQELTRQNRIKRHYTWRERTLQIIKGNIVQIVLSLLILIDAVIVISQIILEIHSMKSKNEFLEYRNHAFVNFITSRFQHFMNNSLLTKKSHFDVSILQDLLSNRSKTESASEIMDWCNKTFIGNTDKIIEKHSDTTEKIHHESFSRSHGTRSDINEAKSKLLHDLGLNLHHISIGVVIVFLIELFLRIICIGTHFFKRKAEMFDGTIIVTSCVADIVYVHFNSEEISVMVVFLLWRIIRLINGLMMHEKQRDEFRIALQKKSRRMCQLKVDRLSTEKELLTKHLVALEELCRELGGNDEQLKNCKPRFKKYSKEQTNNALKSIAALTTGFMGGMIGAPGSNQHLIHRYAGASPSPNVQSPNNSRKLKIMRKISETPFSSFETSENELTPITSNSLLIPSSESPLMVTDKDIPFKFEVTERKLLKSEVLQHSFRSDSEVDDKELQADYEQGHPLLINSEEVNDIQNIKLTNEDVAFETEDKERFLDLDSSTNAHSRGYASFASHSTSMSEPNENDVDENLQPEKFQLTQAERCRTFREKFRSHDAIITQESSLESAHSADEGIESTTNSQCPVTSASK